MYPPLCGGWVVWCLLQTPTGRPYPPAAQAGPEGLGCIRRYVGGGWCGVSSKPPRGVPIPPRPRQDRRDSGVSAVVWGWVVWCLLCTLELELALELFHAKKKKLGGDGAPPRHQLGGPPLNSTPHLTPPRAAEIGAPHGPQTASRGGLWMPPGSRRGWRPSAARTRGASPYFKANWAGNVPPRVSGGASPYIMVSTFSWGSGDPDCQSWGRCQRHGAVSTVAAGAGPCPGRAAVPREFPHPQARTGGGEAHRPPVIALGPHPMMHLCRDTRCDGMGSRENRSEPWGGLGHRETRSTLAYRHPPGGARPVPSWLPTVAGEG